MANEKKSSDSNLKKIYREVGFGMFFLVIIAISVFPREIPTINWSWIFWGGIALGVFFLLKSSKVFRTWAIVAGIVFLLYRAGTLDTALNAIVGIISRLFVPGLVVLGIWLLIKPKKKSKA